MGEQLNDYTTSRVFNASDVFLRNGDTGDSIYHAIACTEFLEICFKKNCLTLRYVCVLFHRLQICQTMQQNNGFWLLLLVGGVGVSTIKSSTISHNDVIQFTTKQEARSNLIFFMLAAWLTSCNLLLFIFHHVGYQLINALHATDYKTTATSSTF